MSYKFKCILKVLLDKDALTCSKSKTFIVCVEFLLKKCVIIIEATMELPKVKFQFRM